MPYTKEEHQEVAQKAKRDQFGHFVKKPASEAKPEGVPPIQTVKVQVEAPKQKQNDADSLVSFNIKNPLTYLTHYINKLLGKPITIKIPPLFAFPIVISLIGIIPASFGLGKVAQKQEIAALPTPTPIIIIQPTATPAPVLVSRMGIIKATYQVAALLSPTTPVILSEPSITRGVEGSHSAEAATPTQIPPLVSPEPTAKAETPVPNRFILVNGPIITFLVSSPELNFSSYLNRKVLITGLYDKIKGTLQINKSGDIEVLP